MTIHDWIEKIKPFYTLILLIFVAILFFGLGRLSALEELRKPIRVYNTPTNASQTGAAVEATLPSVSATSVVSNVPVSADTSADGEVIGSKTGKKYYFPWCGTIKRVKLENQVVFASIALARAAGYTPAGNCKGLK